MGRFCGTAFGAPCVPHALRWGTGETQHLEEVRPWGLHRPPQGDATPRGALSSTIFGCVECVQVAVMTLSCSPASRCAGVKRFVVP